MSRTARGFAIEKTPFRSERSDVVIFWDWTRPGFVPRSQFGELLSAKVSWDHAHLHRLGGINWFELFMLFDRLWKMGWAFLLEDHFNTFPLL